MNRKKIITFLMIILLFIIIILIIMKFIKKDEKIVQTDITPLEEITEEQERQTMISLYFVNSETNMLMPEARRIDAKNLLENPYKALVELLIAGPKNEKLKTVIPEGTKVNKADLKNDILELDLSKEFIENQNGDVEQSALSIYSIVNTLTELNEVNSVKILIDGEENKRFENYDLSLKDTFVRKD